MPLVEQHTGRRAQCEVCRYLATHPVLDRMLYHTLTMFAGWTLLEDLQKAGGRPLSLLSIYTEQFAGHAPGQPAQFEPEHWTLALLAAPEIKLAIDVTEEPV